VNRAGRRVDLASNKSFQEFFRTEAAGGALGVLALIAPGAPRGLKMFLAA